MPIYVYNEKDFGRELADYYITQDGRVAPKLRPIPAKQPPLAVVLEDGPEVPSYKQYVALAHVQYSLMPPVLYTFPPNPDMLPKQARKKLWTEDELF